MGSATQNRLVHRMNFVLAALISAGFGLNAWAQYPAQGDGRLFDANPSLTEGRYNSAIRPVSPLQLGNRAATGNLGGSLSLHSFAPIGDPTAFEASLGSSTLSNFLRDSVSTADAYRSLPSLGGAAYFDPSQTAPTGAFLQGTGGYRDSIPQIGGFRREPIESALPFGGRLDFRIREQNPNARRPSFLDSPTTSTDATIFGLQSQEGIPGEVSFRLPEADAGRPGEDGGDLSQDSPAYAADSPWAPLDLRLTGPSVEPLDFSMSVSGTRSLANRMPSLDEQGGALGDIFAALPDSDTGAPQIDDALLPGGDVFNDMRMALELKDNPQAEWFTDMQRAINDDAVAAEELTNQVAEQAAEFVRTVLDAPLRTFVGKAANPVNDALLEAESLMEMGAYQDAAGYFERARQIDPTNPLPLIGKGHAALATGDYQSAALHLMRGFERFPDLTRFKIDLKSMLGGGEIVDIRRADLMRLLEAGDDPRLQFLLGYLEVFSGKRESGLAHLHEAAERAEFGSFLKRFGDMIEGDKPLPPPRLPDSSPRATMPDANADQDTASGAEASDSAGVEP